ncbi:MAG: selenite/tellurite reduction operon protein ExtJ [Desulfobulbaceae bacterium]
MKKLVTAVMVMVFALSSAGFVMAAKCTVDTIDGDKVTLTCEGADKLKAGDAVEVKSGKKGKKGYEGC